MIKSASFRNFKSLRQVDIDFERLTVLVGPNASGKTSILEGLHYLSQLGSTESQILFEGPRHPVFLVSRGVTSDGMALGCNSEDASIRVVGRPSLP
jgi:predicted ATP-dependent endonuclease of OLD family